MSAVGEAVTLSTFEQAAFAELAEGYDEGLVEDATLAASGLTSVMQRARMAAQEQTGLTVIGVSDVNGEMAAFQSAR